MKTRLSFSSLNSLLQLIVPAVQAAENFIQGPGRGPEKRAAALSNVLANVEEVGKETSPALSKELGFDWPQLIRNLPQLAERLGAVVDALVQLFNFLRRFETVPVARAAGNPPALVN